MGGFEISIDFHGRSGNGYRLTDFFKNVSELEDADTFEGRVIASFDTKKDAVAWLARNYRGQDIDGVGITVDGIPGGFHRSDKWA